jgi:rubrerythrin
MKDSELKQVLHKMLQAELEAMHYYQQASRFIKDKGAIYHFNLLAQEELEHARAFYAVYPDNDLPTLEELISNGQNQQAALEIIDPQLMGRLDERSALQLAMKMEEEVASRLKRMLREVNSPAARAVIEENIDSTLGHLELIREDYQRIFGHPTTGYTSPG